MFNTALEPWVLLSLLAMAANVGKVLLVKTRCRAIDSWSLLFHARVIPAVLLLAALPFIDYTFLNASQFWLATFAAAVLTIGASLLYMEAIKHGDLSIVTPIQASIPVFMMLCTWALYGEVPNGWALLFIALIVVSVSFVLRSSATNKTQTKRAHATRAVWYSCIAAALFGFSTILDRVAIQAVDNGALVFTAYWHLITVALLLPLLWWRRQRVDAAIARNGNIWFYVAVVLTAFICQQLAVQLSLDLDNGVTYVKTIVMMHIVMTAAIGVIYLKEPQRPAIWLANGVTLFSGMGLLWSI